MTDGVVTGMCLTAPRTELSCQRMHNLLKEQSVRWEKRLMVIMSHTIEMIDLPKNPWTMKNVRQSFNHRRSLTKRTFPIAFAIWEK